MKQWTVYFRDKNGSKASVVIEAEDRAGVFAELKRRGISAISVTEGASNKKPRKVAKNSASSKGRGLVAAAIVVLVAGIAAWWMWPGREQVVEEKVPAKRTNNGNKQKSTVYKKENIIKGNKEDRSVANAFENIREFSVRTAITPAKVVVNQSKYTNLVFKTGTEQILSWIFAIQPGQMPLPLPDIEEAERDNLIGILLSRKEVKENDDELSAEIKIVVQEAKEEMLKYIKNGGDPDEFLKYYHNELTRMFNYRNVATDEYQKLMKDDPVLAENFRCAINKKFAEEGIKLIDQENEEGDIVADSE